MSSLEKFGHPTVGPAGRTSPAPHPQEGAYGDVRDVLRALPFHHGGNGYAWTDLFTVRHDIIRQLAVNGDIRSVFEFGALTGYFLVTALHANQFWTFDIGWVDNEQHTPGSNAMCYANVKARDLEGECSLRFYRDRADVPTMHYDLVQVDSDHTYEGCLADLMASERLTPRWIMVDDWTAQHHTAEIQRAVNAWLELRAGAGEQWQLTEYETVNGLALLTKIA